jgi:hypothetical protein
MADYGAERSIYLYRCLKRSILALPGRKVVGGRAAPSASKNLIIIYNALRIKTLRVFGRFFAEIRRLRVISGQIAILGAGEFRLEAKSIKGCFEAPSEG